MTTRPAKTPVGDDGPAEVPPPDIYSIVHYSSPAGSLVAYLTPPPGPEKKMLPAVLWLHGGFGGIGNFFAMKSAAKNDQTPRAFIEDGFVVMIPSTRGMNDNPGHYEMFYGEVDDVLGAVDYLAKLPYVDPSRIYVVGHSTGGTLALLTAEAAPAGKIRAVASFGGAPNMHVSMTTDFVNYAPFDPRDFEQTHLRSAYDFVDALTTPTWYFEGAGSGHAGPAMLMGTRAAAAQAPLAVSIVGGADHFSILRPVTKLVADKFASDSGPTFSATMDPGQAQAAFDHFPKPASRPQLALSKAAIAELSDTVSPNDPPVAVDVDLLGRPKLSRADRRLAGRTVIAAGGAKVQIDGTVFAEMGPMTLDFDTTTERFKLSADVRSNR